MFNRLEPFWGWLKDGNGRYAPTWECSGHDRWLTAIVFLLNIAVLAAYMRIALFWFRSRQRQVGIAANQAQKALNELVAIFVFCGVTGYGFQLVRWVLPLWPVYLLLMSVLAFVSWRYAIRIRRLTVVFRAISSRRLMADQIEKVVDDADTHLTEITHNPQEEAAIRQVLGRIREVIHNTSVSIDRYAGEIENDLQGAQPEV